ncbi:S8 family peptidase [Chengkuizengella axinellae]|uniref:S8 family peptidase n=1 Tax=Chengkuizengella axinellae TaxID=3064388 RepID=A0ABT9IUU2_9BACL|nr:S8 family peptidase [Chengkuizengella sp. 2205SS18-9]MDP5273110.1 S8 family peptidase [Chengkuizengella sp. 2205SS18-9]
MKFYKIALPLVVVTAFALIVIPQGDQKKDEKNTRIYTDQNTEIKVKESVMKQDVNISNDLCRIQCTRHFNKALNELNNSDDKKSILSQMKKNHKNVVQVMWTNLNDTNQAISVGNKDQNLTTKVQEYLKSEGNEILKQNKIYQSETFQYNKDQYFILGVPSENKTFSLIGLIKQDLLNQVAVEQKKNLRIVPYPSDKRYGVKSVDSETLQDVKVDHPEQNVGTSHYHLKEIVVKFNNDPSEVDLQQIQSDIRATSMKKLGYTYVFSSDTMDAEQMMSYFNRWDIEYTEPHYLYMTNEAVEYEPNDILFNPYQWNLPMINTLQGWDLSKGSQNVTVAVIDTGVDLSHLDLKGQLVEGANFVNEDEQPLDDVGHGTHVAGIISASVDNSEGIAGMSWYNKIMPIKVLDSTGAGSTYAVAQGVIWATDNGAKVINMSLGNYAETQFLHDAIKYAYDKDVVLIAATGNDNTDQPGYPAAYPEVLAVSATDESSNKADFSNYGDYLDVMAPGVNIASTYPDGQYAALSGTSMASPHVSALAAMIRSLNPSLKNVEVLDIIRNTSVDLGDAGKDNYYGFGMIQVERALQNASGNQATKSKENKSWFQRLIESLTPNKNPSTVE